MSSKKQTWISDVLLIVVLVLAAYLRFTGAGWGELQHQHPDELFLTGVVTKLRAQKCVDPTIVIDACPAEQQQWIGLGDYFNTKASTLNPYNRGFGFFVYGTLPLFIVRFTAELLAQTDPGALKLLGRQFSSLADLGTIFILYLIVARLYNRRTALLSAAFSALAVMQIQQSHFFTTDLFVNLFTFLAIYFAVRILTQKRILDDNGPNKPEFINSKSKHLDHSTVRNPFLWLSLAFGFSFGLAMASKISIFPLALLLPAAFAVRFLENKEERNHYFLSDRWKSIVIFLIAGGLAAVVTFRIFQPYAFDGFLLNEQWFSNIAEQRVQARGDADLPWNLQWARRTHLYSFRNLTVWGLGLPLGILAWVGFFGMGWRILKGEWKHALLWVWTAGYFIWQSLQFNPTMRYQLPIYPLLAMMAAWFIISFSNTSLSSSQRITWKRIFVSILGVIVLVSTAIWAYAFHTIYVRDETRMAASHWIYQNVPGPINIHVQTPGGQTFVQPLAFFSDSGLQADLPFVTSFNAMRDGSVSKVKLGYIVDSSASGTQTISLQIASEANAPPEKVLANATLSTDFAPISDPRGRPATLLLDHPLTITEGQVYFLKLETTGGNLLVSGSAVANETDYDFTLPFRTEFDGFSGIYRGDLNFQVYWNDDAAKLERFSSTLDQADYIFIPTNHQYGQITRIPERYPLTTTYYRGLLGCPPESNIIECYRVAQPGMFTGTLGFDLIAVFESHPTFGSVVINDQAAEEAFTFYDHPKVLIFKKRADYDPAQVRAYFGAVDLTNVVHLKPREAASHKSLMLWDYQLARQRAGGTWSNLFDYDHLQNKYPIMGLAIWYLSIFLLGALTYPIIRLVLPGLKDKGYPLARTLGLVILAYVPWLLGSFGVAYSRTMIGVVVAAIAVTGISLGWLHRGELLNELKTNWRHILIIEGVFLSFFIFDLLIRLGNPDLWHPSKGGERPMDFSYFNAVLKSTSFPPYDPWFAGGYINYYYYGFVLVGTPVKLLGIVPSIAYNFILPTLFALVAINAYSIGWNLLSFEFSRGRRAPDSQTQIINPYIAGLAAACLMVLLGNLGSVQMIFRAFAQIAAPGGILTDSNFFQRVIWAGSGVYKNIFEGITLPIGLGTWYWNPSRVIPPGPGNEITEFPFFTFLYSDLHAHMIVMPLALFVFAWSLSTVLARQTSIFSVAIGALVIGALFPTNLSDMYTYLPVAITALGYALWRSDNNKYIAWLPNLSPTTRRVIAIVLYLALMSILSFWFYAPYRATYNQAYSKLDPWTASQTPILSYLTHWGLFLFLIFVWLVWETREWMAATPVSALGKLKQYKLLIEAMLVVFIVSLLYLAYRNIWVGWIVLLMGTWAGLLMLRVNLEDSRRLVLFWVGTALLITLVVELVTVRGDIGRMNTIFKFYLHSWTFLSISAGVAFAWVLSVMHLWLPRWRIFWQIILATLLACAALFTLSATIDKIKDRINPDAPHTFDTMTFMAHSEFWDSKVMDLSQDYHAIRWMQDNVQGSPVIVETNCPEYRWCSRFTIYTGLPGVVGWNWHQRQQRAHVQPNHVTDRVDAINDFYSTPNIVSVRDFIATYDVRYIIVGQLEQIYYPGDGLAKFKRYDEDLWKSVYQDTQTTIYEVLP